MKDIANAQKHMRLNGIDGWILPDFRGSNKVHWDVIGERGFTTRKCVIFIPAEGEPRGLLHVLDEPQSGSLFPRQTELYRTQGEYQAWLRQNIAQGSVIATEYSPLCAIPTLSAVDGGTIELFESLGSTVVSSADLIQSVFSIWETQSLESQELAIQQTMTILNECFDFISSSLKRPVAITEYDVQQRIVTRFAEFGLETFEDPVVAVNENSGRPHYMPNSEVSSPIRRGDWLLIDLWAKRPGSASVFADITWVATVGSPANDHQLAVFDTVRRARDAVVEELGRAWQEGYHLAGWQLDDIARDVITEAGYGENILHRTGHSMAPGPELHALGVNLDNFETHDTRLAVPGVGFSVEPGIYLAEFGVRSEIDVYIHPESGPIVTSPIQTQITVIDV